MTRESTEKSLAKRAAHAMRAATLRFAQEGAGEDAAPYLAYGCVDWFRYDAATPAGKTDPKRPSPAAGAERPGVSAR